MSVGSKPWSPGVLHCINIYRDSIVVEIIDVCVFPYTLQFLKNYILANYYIGMIVISSIIKVVLVY